jgi:uncharacterized protein (DUF488 family)
VTLSFFTIGHSTRSLPEFVDLLHKAEVRAVADVRKIPRSRTNPQYNAETLPGALAEHQIGYEHLAKLGGLRGRRRGADPSPNSFWENDSFRNYADYAATEPFQEGLRELRALGRLRRCAVMCAEAVWWRCHRRIIADYLIIGGDIVWHILGPGHIEPAKLTPAARVQPDGSVVYASAS